MIFFAGHKKSFETSSRFFLAFGKKKFFPETKLLRMREKVDERGTERERERDNIEGRERKKIEEKLEAERKRRKRVEEIKRKKRERREEKENELTQREK